MKHRGLSTRRYLEYKYFYCKEIKKEKKERVKAIILKLVPVVHHFVK
jgi:hypothetical protein